MEKVTLARKYRRNFQLLRALQYLFVPHRSARLDDIPNAGLRYQLNGVRKWKKASLASTRSVESAWNLFTRSIA